MTLKRRIRCAKVLRTAAQRMVCLGRRESNGTSLRSSRTYCVHVIVQVPAGTRAGTWVKKNPNLDPQVTVGNRYLRAGAPGTAGFLTQVPTGTCG